MRLNNICKKIITLAETNDWFIRFDVNTLNSGHYIYVEKEAIHIDTDGFKLFIDLDKHKFKVEELSKWLMEVLEYNIPELQPEDVKLLINQNNV